MYCEDFDMYFSNKASTCEKFSEVDSKKEVFVQVLLTYVTQAAVVSTS